MWQEKGGEVTHADPGIQEKSVVVRVAKELKPRGSAGLPTCEVAVVRQHSDIVRSVLFVSAFLTL